MKKLVCFDSGSTGILSYDGKSITRWSPKDLIPFVLSLDPGTLLVGEYAHFGCPRSSRSKAQPFTVEELQELYSVCEDCDIELRLFPQKSTTRALHYAKIRKPKSAKDDDRDAEAIWILLKAYPKTSLMHPPRSFEVGKLRQESYDIKDALNCDMNEKRRFEGGYFNEADANYILLKAHIEEIIDNLSPMARSAFGLDQSCRYKKTGKVNFNNIKMTQITSILTILQDSEGNLRKRTRTGQLPGWKFVKRYVIGMTPFHLRGGVVRSNVYWHGLRHWVAEQAAKATKITKKEFLGQYRGGYYDEDQGIFIKQMTPEEEAAYLKYRRLYCKAVKELYMAFKRLLEKTRANELGVQEAIVST